MDDCSNMIDSEFIDARSTWHCPCLSKTACPETRVLMDPSPALPAHAEAVVLAERLEERHLREHGREALALALGVVQHLARRQRA